MSGSQPSRSSTARFVADILHADAKDSRSEDWRRFRGLSDATREAPRPPPRFTRDVFERSGKLDEARTLAADIALFSEHMADENGQPLRGERLLVTYPHALSPDNAAFEDPVYLRLMPGPLMDDVFYEVEVASSLAARPPLPRIIRPLTTRLQQLGVYIIQRGLVSGEITTQSDYLDDLLFAFQPIIVVAQMPPMIPLCAPFPCIEVTTGDKVSTAGILVRAANGQRGFTAAYHATGPVGTPVRLGAFDTVVAAASELHDIVFLPLPDGVNLPELRGLRGIMVARSPWDNEPARFWGSTTGDRETFVISHDKGLPDVVRGRQRCVQTDPDTNEGDSGAALVNQDDQVVGFAFQRTSWGKKPQFTDWVWARGALDALELRADFADAGGL